jgi:hypothetical protein
LPITRHPKDDGVSVREAAVELLAKHITTDPALAEDYFEVLAEASTVRCFRIQMRLSVCGPI